MEDWSYWFSFRMDLNSVSALFGKINEPSVKDELMTLMQGYLQTIAEQNVESSLRQKMGTSDIVQQSFLQVIEHFENFRGESTAQFKAWLKTIVINEIKKSRRSFFTVKRDVKRETTFADQAEPVPSQTSRFATPSTEALASERIETFHAVLQELSGEDAMVIRLRSIEGLTFEEVGQRMNRSKDNVSKLWYRAVIKFEAKLRAILGNSV